MNQFWKLPDHIDTSVASQAGFIPKYNFISETALAGLSGPRWLIKGLLPAKSFSVVYGAPGEGKSHAAVALALGIAHGLECLGRRTASGAVVYIAAEGVSGLALRVRAWREHHGIAASAEGGVQFIDQAVQLLKPSEVEALALSIVHGLKGQPVRLVIIDTLARCFLDGDENTAQDMSRFVQACQLLQNALDCAVMVLHHQPKSGAGGPRGNGALKGAADTQIHVSKVPGGFHAEIEKQKDGKDNLVIRAHYEPVRLGLDEDGDQLVVPVAVLDDVVEKVGLDGDEPTALGRNQQTALAILRAAGAQGLDEAEWRRRFEQSGAGGTIKPARAFREARDGLGQKQLVRLDGQRYTTI